MDKNAFIQQMRFESSIHLTDINGESYDLSKAMFKTKLRDKGTSKEIS